MSLINDSIDVSAPLSIHTLVWWTLGVTIWKRKWRKIARGVTFDIAKYKPQGRPGTQLDGTRVQVTPDTSSEKLKNHRLQTWMPWAISLRAYCPLEVTDFYRSCGTQRDHKIIVITEHVSTMNSWLGMKWGTLEPRKGYTSLMPPLMSSPRVEFQLNQTLIMRIGIPGQQPQKSLSIGQEKVKSTQLLTLRMVWV